MRAAGESVARHALAWARNSAHSAPLTACPVIWAAKANSTLMHICSRSSKARPWSLVATSLRKQANATAFDISLRFKHA